MKYITVVICFTAIVCFNSCKKGNAVKNTSNNTSITGTWELESAYGGTPLVQYPSGNGNNYAFTDSGYKKYTKGNLVKSGYYTIVEDTSVREEVGLLIFPGQFTNRIIFDGDASAKKIFIEILNDKLTFLAGFFPLDGGSSMTYKRNGN
ncbi:MAG: hypothetical protein ABJB86_08750 [Bacteroidota bacterium]